MDNRAKNTLILWIPLVVLVINDHVLKSIFPGFITGKLSDFAGLWVWAVFFLFLFRNRAKEIALFSSLLFIWWKSPLSSSFIQYFHEAFNISLHRTIDYTDLVALSVFYPFIYFHKNLLSLFESKLVFLKTPFLVLSGIAICATSAPDYSVNPNWIFNNQSYNIGKTKKEIIKNTIGKSYAGSLDTLALYRVFNIRHFSTPAYEAQILIDSVGPNASKVNLIATRTIYLSSAKETITKEKFLEHFEKTYIKQASTADSTLGFTIYTGVNK